jgi:hypothetical protein
MFSINPFNKNILYPNILGIVICLINILIYLWIKYATNNKEKDFLITKDLI